MPRSIFLGSPFPGPGVPLWSDSDRDWALALLAIEADTCDGCGQPRSETMVAANEDAYKATAIRCHGCAAIGRAQYRTTNGKDPNSATGLGFHVTKTRSTP